MALHLSVRQRGDITIIDIRGDLLLAECAALPLKVKELLAAGRRKFALNLEGINHTDSTGIGALVASFTSVRNRGGMLKVFHPSPKVLDVMQLTHLDQVFAIFPHETDALAKFQ